MKLTKVPTAAVTQAPRSRRAEAPAVPVAVRVRVVPAVVVPEVKYLSFLSHDLNNNLDAISLHLRLLRDRLIESPEFSQELSMLDLAQETISHTTEGMQRLRKRHSRPQIVPLSLHELADRVAAHHSRQAKSRGLALRVDVPPDAIVYSDVDLIFIILQNLLGNAVKYSDRGTVRLFGRRCGGDPVLSPWVLSVTDQGPGISPHLLHSIFREFQRGESLCASGGAGLGLAIASEAAQLLGADLSVNSELGVGSTFRLTLNAGLLAEMATHAAARNGGEMA